MTIDHVIPRSRGGGNTWSNLVTCCKKCNQKKRDRTPEEANMKLLNEPRRPKNSVLRQISDVNRFGTSAYGSRCIVGNNGGGLPDPNDGRGFRLSYSRYKTDLPLAILFTTVIGD